MPGAKKKNWRDSLVEKLQLVDSIDNEVNVRTEQLEQDFDLVAFRHHHDAWLDAFHQRLAREEMNIREQESIFPILHEKIAQYEENLKQQDIKLREVHGDKLKDVRSFSPKRTSQIVPPNYVMESWLTEASALNQRKYYKLSPSTSTTPVRLYGFDTDISKSPVSIVEIPVKSAITTRSATVNSEWSFQLRTTHNINKVFHCDSENLRDTWISTILYEMTQVRGEKVVNL